MANPSEREQEKGRLSADDAALLSGEIAGLTAAGLPLAPGLRATSQEMPRGRLRWTLESVADALDRGVSVDEALAAQGASLPGYMRGLIAVGSRTGRVSDVLGRLTAFNSIGDDLRRRLLISLAYPLLSLAIALAVFTFVCTVLVPSFEAIFKDFGISLPVITMVVIRVSHLFTVSWPTAAELLVSLGVLWVLTYFVLGASTRRAIIGSLPVLGVVWRYTSLAEFCHLLALLLESDVPLIEALRLTGDGVRDDSVHRACAVMARDVEGGLTLSQALSGQSIFPKGMARVLRWAEGHQSLIESLHMAGEMFEAGARGQGGLAGVVIAVFVMIAILFVMGMVVIGLFLPLIQLISKLSG